MPKYMYWIHHRESSPSPPERFQVNLWNITSSVKPDKAGFSAVAHMWNGQKAHLRKEVIKKQKVCNLDTKSAAEQLSWVVTIVIFKTVHFFIYYRLSSICQTHNKLDTAMRMDLVQLSEFWASYTIEISFSF